MHGTSEELLSTIVTYAPTKGNLRAAVSIQLSAPSPSVLRGVPHPPIHDLKRLAETQGIFFQVLHILSLEFLQRGFDPKS